MKSINNQTTTGQRQQEHSSPKETLNQDLHHHHDHHGHHHHEHNIQNINTIYIVSVTLNLLFVLVEAGFGLFSKSLGLLSDAGHNLSDVFSLLLAMLAFKLSTTAATKRYTYGYRKTSILISLLNAVILLIAVGAIIIESVVKFSHPVAINGVVITWVAAIGIIINGATAWALSKQQKHDINTRGAYLHMLADTLVSVGVVVAGVIISKTNWYWIDPLIGIIIAVIILVSTTKLLIESFKMSIDAVPEDVNIDKIVSMMEQTEGVLNIHHVHIWSISTTEKALTAHIVIKDHSLLETVTTALKQLLDKEGIHHSTLELETDSSHCCETTCQAHPLDS